MNAEVKKVVWIAVGSLVAMIIYNKWLASRI